MKNLCEEAIQRFFNWNLAFNSIDVEAQIDNMHFPNLRLANNQFEIWKTPNDFRASHEEMTIKLAQ
tara:strand:+ start:116 stop:313 length:198 start_codon:yes stop_codon:yes gene_type:complete